MRLLEVAYLLALYGVAKVIQKVVGAPTSARTAVVTVQAVPVQAVPVKPER